MKLSILAVFAVACVFAFAQDSQVQNTQKEHSITGCLRSGSAPNTYMISSRDKGAPIAAAIVSSSADLASHLGQKVKITGTLVPAEEAETHANVPKAFHYMDVKAIKKISKTCP
jgi:hypothetical protein